MEARTNLTSPRCGYPDRRQWVATQLQEHSPDSRRSSQASMRPTGAEASEPSTTNEEELEWEVETEDEPQSSKEAHRHRHARGLGGY